MSKSQDANESLISDFFKKAKMLKTIKYRVLQNFSSIFLGTYALDI